MISDITDELSGSGAPTAWVEGCVTAQAALDRALEGLEDATARNPSLLPGWSVGHLLTHLARNADSVVWRLAGGAGGEQRDQYPGGMTQRHNDIEDGAGRPAGELVLDVRRTSQAVERVMRELPAPAWDSLSRNSRGVAESARLVVLSRWREVVLHRVDLGLGPVDIPSDLIAATLPRDIIRLPERCDPADLWTWVLGRGEAPALRPWEASRGEERT